jgi:ABC-2 type transport system permease protein
MSHVLAIASREIRSLFVSPVAYVVLTLWSVLAGTFFLSTLVSFDENVRFNQQFQQMEQLASMNLNDSLISPFIGAMWVVMLFLLPAVTMGLFANDKSQSTDELLLTSPLAVWEIVLGKFLAGALFATLMTAIVAFFPAMLFLFGDPEPGKTATGLLGLLLVSWAYVSVGGFASSLTRNQLIAFVIALVLLLVLGLMLPFLIDVTVVGTADGEAGWLTGAMRWIATGYHVESLLNGVIDTADIAYFFVVIAMFLTLTRTIVESARWR